MTNETSLLSSAAVMFLHAQTALHPGSGTALGVVDLPVQRERHTRWPLIPGSALKGVLRDRCRELVRKKDNSSRQKANEDHGVVTVFGPGKVQEESDHAGALAITDARILAFPVRSLKGVFAWVTSPAVLERLARDLKLAGQQPPPLPAKWPENEQALCAADSPLVVEGKSLVLEEFEFECVGDAGEIGNWLAERAFDDDFTRTRIKSNLAVLADDDFNHFVQHATEVMARIALDYDHKTVKQGALFYQEFLPPETLFYSLLLAHDSRRRNGDAAAEEYRMTAASVLSWLAGHLKPPAVLQIGGDETTGKGLCSVRIVNGEEVRS